MKHIIVFEDGLHDRYYPLALTRPLWELRCGIHSFRERVNNWCARTFPDRGYNLHFFTRDYLVQAWCESLPGVSLNDKAVLGQAGEFIFINATIFPETLASLPPENTIIVRDGLPLFARIDGGKLGPGSAIPEKIMSSTVTRVEDGGLRYSRFIWELVSMNANVTDTDIRDLGISPSDRRDVAVVGDRELFFCDDDVRIDPFVVIDVTNGPVYIRRGTVVNPFTRIEGPAYIGRDCLLLGAKVREGCSIGDVCRIGGEIEETIIQGYSNKYHDGFIGHSYVGEWINLGAMTTCSDLKNNYSPVTVTMPWGKQNTSMSKVGCFIGDFARTSIGTLINTGAVIGTGAMVIHSGGLTPRHIPPFRWYINGIVEERDWIEDFISTCARITSRRNVEFQSAGENLYRELFRMTR